jgi:hypothetical protein
MYLEATFKEQEKKKLHSLLSRTRVFTFQGSILHKNVHSSVWTAKFHRVCKNRDFEGCIMYSNAHGSRHNQNSWARANQHPPVHQLDFLYTGCWWISQSLVTFFGANPLLFFLFEFVLVFFPNFDLTCPAPYYLPSWRWLPIYNQAPSFSPTYLL